MSNHRKHSRWIAGALAGISALPLASCTSGEVDAAETTISVLGPWTRENQKSFEAVLDGFREANPDIAVEYTPAGDSMVTVLSTAVEGGDPPDIAVIPQPGLVQDFARQGELEPLDFLVPTLEENFSPSVAELGTVDGETYSFIFKAANKSTVWYNVAAFENAGVAPPESFEEMVTSAETLTASGVPAYAVAGADGWTLTDLFENVYLRQAGPEKYDQLSRHEIPWTDPSVKAALKTMAEVLGADANLAGGRSQALQTDFSTAVEQVFTETPAAAMIIEADFTPGSVATELEPGTGYDVFAFPSIADSPEAVVGGGDSLVMFNDSEPAQALMEYLATPEAAAIWAGRGGYASANLQVPEEAYRDDISQAIAAAITEAETFRFDMSDLAPAAFGATPGRGEFKILQDFLADPDRVDATAEALEAAATEAYGG